MTAESVLHTLSLTEMILCFGVWRAIARRGVTEIYPALVGFIALLAGSQAVRTSILFYRQMFHVPLAVAYKVLFYCGWTAQLLELCLLVVIIFGLFSEAMRPFPGLQRIGRLIFRWVGAVSLIVAVALSVGPDLFSRTTTLMMLYAEMASRFQQGINVLILCLLVFVCFAIKPLGLTFRSHIFGVVLGLGVFSTVQLIQAAWLALTASGLNLYSSIYAFEAGGGCVALLVWGTYFALPEPKRRMILLPTTSPFFLWNRISEILGDAPGNVAVAGFTPDMLAPAEIEMLTIAISREEAMDQERELPLSAGAGFRGIAELPAGSERAFALSR